MPRIIKILLLAAFLNAITWISITPMWQYPDEQAHFAQVQNRIEQNKKLETKTNTSLEIHLSEIILGTKRDGLGRNKYTYQPDFNVKYSNNQFGIFESALRDIPKDFRTTLVKKEATANPPLYHFLASFFYKTFEQGSIFERVFAVRLFSSLLFILLITVSYKIGKVVFKNILYALTLASLVAFKPMLVHSSTGVLPDPLTNLLFAAVILVSLLIIKSGPSIQNIILGFGIVIAGTFTRQQFLISIPILFGSIILRFINVKSIKLIFTLLAFIICVIALGFILPAFAYIKSFSLPEIGTPNLFLLLTMDFMDFTKSILLEANNQIFAWYWGVYRWLSLTVPLGFYQIIKTITFISTIGILIKIVQIIKKKEYKENISIFFLIYASLIYFAVIFIWDYYFRLQHGFSFGIQGRYFFPLVVAHLALILIGLRQIIRLISINLEKYILLLLVLAMILFNDFSLFHLARSYYSTESLNQFIIQASQYKPIFLKGWILILIPILAILSQMFLIYKILRFNNE